MTVVAQTRLKLSGAQFRSFQETRPDRERWELIDGVPIMMVPPILSHQRIADNLARLLNDALARHEPTRIAISRAGVDLGETALAAIEGDDRPEPDVMVIDADFEPLQRFVQRAYVIAEIMSDTDHAPVASRREPWIAVKRRLYLAHPPCETVLLIDPYGVEVSLDLRSATRWHATKLTHLEEWLELPNCGLRCRIAEIYDGTPLYRTASHPGQRVAE